jgi:nitroimidazol reductase NimA-like FMN-containing flavoprotein (pyridoxamine 5'-phosphate oxidase superfamily)
MVQYQIAVVLKNPVRRTSMDNDIREKARELIRKRGTCVLATATKNRPYCSLMAYACNETCSELYMLTGRETRKYRNLMENPAVSILIDTRRSNLESDHKRTTALTLSGKFEPVMSRSEERGMREGIKTRHPGLGDLLDDPDTEVVRIKIDSYLLLMGPKDAHYEENVTW